MTQEEKEILLKTFCSKLPYELKANVILFNKNIMCVITGVSLNKSTGLYSIEIRKPNRELQCIQWPTDIIKPYLRPMSSMTDEEKMEYHIIDDRAYTCPEEYAHIPASDRIDYLDAHYLDYRGLIPKGLAIEAPEGMYKIVSII